MVVLHSIQAQLLSLISPSVLFMENFTSLFINHCKVIIHFVKNTSITQDNLFS